MIDRKMRQNRDMALIQIWTRMTEGEKSQVMGLFPTSKTIDDPEVKEYIFKHYHDKLIEVIVK